MKSWLLTMFLVVAWANPLSAKPNVTPVNSFLPDDVTLIYHATITRLLIPKPVQLNPDRLESVRKAIRLQMEQSGIEPTTSQVDADIAAQLSSTNSGLAALTLEPTDCNITISTHNQSLYYELNMPDNKHGHNGIVSGVTICSADRTIDRYFTENCLYIARKFNPERMEYLPIISAGLQSIPFVMSASENATGRYSAAVLAPGLSATHYVPAVIYTQRKNGVSQITRIEASSHNKPGRVWNLSDQLLIKSAWIPKHVDAVYYDGSTDKPSLRIAYSLISAKVQSVSFAEFELAYWLKPGLTVYSSDSQGNRAGFAYSPSKTLQSQEDEAFANQAARRDVPRR